MSSILLIDRKSQEAQSDGSKKGADNDNTCGVQINVNGLILDRYGGKFDAL